MKCNPPYFPVWGQTPDVSGMVKPFCDILVRGAAVKNCDSKSAIARAGGDAGVIRDLTPFCLLIDDLSGKYTNRRGPELGGLNDLHN